MGGGRGVRFLHSKAQEDATTQRSTNQAYQKSTLRVYEIVRKMDEGGDDSAWMRGWASVPGHHTVHSSAATLRLFKQWFLIWEEFLIFREGSAELSKISNLIKILIKHDTT